MNEPKSILLAEDNSLDVEMTLGALHTIGGADLVNSVAVVRDGQEALEYLHARGRYEGRPPGLPVLVLLDLKMPLVDGLGVLDQIRKDERLRLVPVVMLTSSREESDLVRSYKLGINAYVVKPVDFTAFDEAVKQLGIFWLRHNEVPSRAKPV